MNICITIDEYYDQKVFKSIRFMTQPRSNKIKVEFVNREFQVENSIEVDLLDLQIAVSRL